MITFFFLYEEFEIYSSNQGAQGILRRPSHQELDAVFETHNDDEVIEIILEKGVLQRSGTFKSPLTLNVARGSADTRV